MGTVYNTNVVTDGIKFYWDGANRKSYPGTGTVWTDLAGNTIGTLTNFTGGAEFDSANGGGIAFDGTDSVILTSANSDFGTGPLTAAFWIKRDNAGGHVFVTCGYNTSPSTGDNNLSVGAFYNQIDYLLGGTWAMNPQPDITSPIVEVDKWYYYVFTRSGTDVAFYLNANLLATDSISGSAEVVSLQIGLGAQLRNASPLSVGHVLEGTMASAVFYNTLLTDAEVKQNYNATKGRFT